MGFVFRLIPPRASFQLDMSPEERATMVEHVAYWSALAHQGTVLAFGPVDDPEGPYGIGIIIAESRGQAEQIRDDDPAVRSPHGFRAELAPMLRVITRTDAFSAFDATPA